MININLTIERRHLFMIAALVVVAALLVPAGAWASHQFSDVPNSDWAHDDISWIRDAGVTLGCGDGNYCPDDFVTRREMAAFLQRLGTKQVVDAKEVNGGTAWMWSDEESPEFFVPVVTDPIFAYNSEGGSITYTRMGVGQYWITFPGWDTIGHSQVTAYSPPASGINCVNFTWGGGIVKIRCHDSAAGLADTRFSILILGN